MPTGCWCPEASIYRLGPACPLVGCRDTSNAPADSFHDGIGALSHIARTRNRKRSDVGCDNWRREIKPSCHGGLPAREQYRQKALNLVNSFTSSCRYFPNSGGFGNKHYRLWAINRGNIVGHEDTGDVTGGGKTYFLSNSRSLRGTVLTSALTLWVYIKPSGNYTADGAKTADALCHTGDNVCIYQAQAEDCETTCKSKFLAPGSSRVPSRGLTSGCTWVRTERLGSGTSELRARDYLSYSSCLHGRPPHLGSSSDSLGKATLSVGHLNSG